MILYRATNTMNGKCYVGITRKSLAERRSEHFWAARAGRNGCRKFARAIRKYGQAAFNWEVIARFNNYEDLLAAERAVIAATQPAYNISPGGCYGVLGLPRTEEWSRNISKGLRGRKPSAQCLAAREAASGKCRRSVVCLTDGTTYGGVKTAAARYGLRSSAISNVCSGREISTRGLIFAYAESCPDEASRQRLLAQATARKASAAKVRGESRRANAPPPLPKQPKIRRPNGRPVVCLDDGVIYESAAEAARAYGIRSYRNIVTVIAGLRDSAGGRRFGYAEEH